MTSYVKNRSVLFSCTSRFCPWWLRTESVTKPSFGGVQHMLRTQIHLHISQQLNWWVKYNQNWRNWWPKLQDTVKPPVLQCCTIAQCKVIFSCLMYYLVCKHNTACTALGLHSMYGKARREHTITHLNCTLFKKTSKQKEEHMRTLSRCCS